MTSFTVMIVEDEPLIGAAMEMLVEDLGGATHGPFMTLKDGLAGLDQLVEHHDARCAELLASCTEPRCAGELLTSTCGT